MDDRLLKQIYAAQVLILAKLMKQEEKNFSTSDYTYEAKKAITNFADRLES